MKVAVCLQHVPFEGPGVLRHALESRGYSVTCHIVPTEGLPLDPGNLLLIMGGPMSVNDPDPWIESERRFVKTALERGLPVLGICFGAQLLAKVLGWSVAPGPTFEIGMVPGHLNRQWHTGSCFWFHAPNLSVCFNGMEKE